MAGRRRLKHVEADDLIPKLPAILLPAVERPVNRKNLISRNAQLLAGHGARFSASAGTCPQSATLRIGFAAM
jgi:hypothetical protein